MIDNTTTHTVYRNIKTDNGNVFIFSVEILQLADVIRVVVTLGSVNGYMANRDVFKSQFKCESYSVATAKINKLIDIESTGHVTFDGNEAIHIPDTEFMLYFKEVNGGINFVFYNTTKNTDRILFNIDTIKDTEDTLEYIIYSFKDKNINTITFTLDKNTLVQTNEYRILREGTISN